MAKNPRLVTLRFRFATEARLNIGFAVLMIVVMAPGLSKSEPTFWFSLTMLCAWMLWIWRNWRYGTAELSAEGLWVQGYGRARHLSLAELAGFESVRSRRGMGYSRDVLTALRRHGDAIKFDCLNDRPGSIRLQAIVAELNVFLGRLQLEEAREATP